MFSLSVSLLDNTLCAFTFEDDLFMFYLFVTKFSYIDIVLGQLTYLEQTKIALQRKFALQSRIYKADYTQMLRMKALVVMRRRI